MPEDPSKAQNQSTSNNDIVRDTKTGPVRKVKPEEANDPEATIEVNIPPGAGSNNTIIPNSIIDIIPNTDPEDILPRGSFSIPINFTSGNFRINLEYQDRFYKQCLISERITSYVSLALIICGVLFTLGGVIYPETRGLPVNVYSILSGMFTSVIGGVVYKLNVGARDRLHDTAKELSNLGRFVMAKNFIDQITNLEKKDDQLVVLSQEMIKSSQGGNQEQKKRRTKTSKGQGHNPEHQQAKP